ncbi:hypothetical protein [uncultured Fibrella sp.]|uniref:hypothetical protein n=1 Tax=uncultured Fibrella sp. TaxID=1284596 RepID=UPI0035CAAC16
MQSGTANVYLAILPGEYRVTAGGLNCPNNTCCPIIIQEIPGPAPLSVSAIAATCSSTAATALSNAQLVLSSTVVAGLSFNISPGNSFSASTALFANNLPTTGLVVGSVIASGLANPATIAGDTYTVRVFTTDECFTDTVVTVPRTECACPPVKCAPFTIRKVR